MTLLAPIWLLLLVPWAIACLWIGRDAGRATRVPFLSLWPTPLAKSGRRRRRPPVWVMLLLAAAALSIVAAAGPVWRAAGIRVAPVRPPANVGIVRFAVVDRPRPQAMVRVVNHSDRRRATLRVDAVERMIDLPTTGTSADFFLDLPTLGDTTTATLQTDDGRPWADDVAADDRATLTRATSPPRLEPRTALPDALARFAAVYTARRPAGPRSATVAIVRGDSPSGPAIILATSLAAGDGPVTVDAGHPVSRSVDPLALATAGRSPGPPPGNGWRTLVRAGDAVLLAVRESPVRQVWVGVDTAAWANAPAYVVFWADAFDWAGGGESAWTPAGGPASAGLSSDARSRGAGQARVAEATPPGVGLAPGLLGVALGMILVALWAGRRLTDN